MLFCHYGHENEIVKGEVRILMKCWMRRSNEKYFHPTGHSA